MLHGNFKDDIVSGIVYIRYDDGGVYVGYYENNQIHGRGRMEYISGDIYEGRFGSELKEGFGVYKWADGSIFAGFWNKDQPHGFGLSVNTEQETSFCIYSHGAKSRLLKNHVFESRDEELKFIKNLDQLICNRSQNHLSMTFGLSQNIKIENHFDGHLDLEDIEGFIPVRNCELATLQYDDGSSYTGGFKLNRFNG